MSSESSVFYLLHQPVILSVGWFIIRWDTGVLTKLTVLAVVSFLLIMVLFELLVRRYNIVRFFFGMRPKRKPLSTAKREIQRAAV